MNIINKNIKFLRKQKKMTQQEFADLLGIKRSSLGAYEEGRANPNLEILDSLTQEFNITIDQLLKDDLSEMTEQQIASGAGMDVQGKRLRVLSITVDKENREFIELVPQKAAAGYLTGYSDPEFVEELPKFRLPMLPEGTYRAFEITGDSMLPLQPGSVVIGEYVSNWHELKDGHTYIVVAEKEGVVYKRVFNHIEDNKELILKSDNPSYPPYPVKVQEVLEMWKAKAYISTIFPDNEISLERLTNMVMELQQEVIRLRSK